MNPYRNGFHGARSRTRAPKYMPCVSGVVFGLFFVMISRMPTNKTYGPQMRHDFPLSTRGIRRPLPPLATGLHGRPKSSLSSNSYRETGVIAPAESLKFCLRVASTGKWLRNMSLTPLNNSSVMHCSQRLRRSNMIPEVPLAIVATELNFAQITSSLPHGSRILSKP